MNKTTEIVFVNKRIRCSQEKENLVRDLKDIFSIIEDANDSYEIWWILVSDDGRKKYFWKMFHYKEFFQPTAYAHIISIVINLYKLFETRKDTLNFQRLIKEAEKMGLLDSKQIKNELEEAKALWIKISILRNKLFAHKNYHLTREAIYREAKINPNQIKRLIELSLIIFNSLWTCLRKKSKGIAELSTRDTNRVLEELKKIRNV